MKRCLLSTLVLLCSFSAWSQAVNDDCAARITLTVATGGANSYSFDSSTATESLDASCEAAGNNNLDVWYEFTMPVNGNVYITGVPGTVTRSLFDSCGGTELACGGGNGFFYNLTSGTTYVLRMAENAIFAGTVNFNIEAFETLANDECANRTSITVGTGGALSYSFDSRAATESMNASCEFAANENLDVWYEFTMPVDGNVYITGIPATISRALFDSCGGTELNCGTGNGFFYSLSSGTTYVLRMAENAVFAGAVNFNIEAFATLANDECANRTSITVTTGSPSSYSFDSRAATESINASCESAGNANLDVWYEFTMPVDGNIRITGTPNTITRSIFDTCGGSELGCGVGEGFFYSLTSGTTYVLRMAENSVFSGLVNFNIEAFETLANDECVNRIPITVNTGGALTYSLDSRAATESLDASCESAGNANLDAWYEFTMPVNGNVRITGIPTTISRSLFDACGGSELDCGAGDGFFFTLNAGTTYVLRIAENSVFSGAINFSIEAFETVPNNDCSTALPITAGVVAPTVVPFDPRGATESMDAGCESAGNINMDQWYVFQMPFNGDVTFTGLTSLTTVSLYDACGGSELYCQGGNGTAFGLTGGVTFYLRAARNSVFAGANTFNVLAVPAPLPTCTTTTEWMSGSWNNGVPTLGVNAVIRTNYDTATQGSFSCCSLAIDSGTTLYVRGGDYVEVAYGVNVAGTLDINHEGSLVQRDGASVTTNNGIIRVRKTTPFLKPRDFMIMGSPMDGETRNGVYNNAFLVLNHITANFVPNPSVAIQFPMAENFADDNGDNWAIYAAGPHQCGEGYLVRPNLPIPMGIPPMIYSMTKEP
ncbi:MAG: hypothetical protein R2793_07235 [Flavobacteriaceae bacterium]